MVKKSMLDYGIWRFLANWIICSFLILALGLLGGPLVVLAGTVGQGIALLVALVASIKGYGLWNLKKH